MGSIFYIIGMTLLWGIITLTIVQVVMGNRQPAKTMAWALVILFLPLVGIILYFFFGVSHRRERLISQRSLDQLSKRAMLSFVEQPHLRIPEQHKPLVDLFVNQSMALPFADNQTDIMTDGYAFIPSLLRDIAQARHHIHLCMYIIADDPLGRLVTDALKHKARQGVEVRVIFDDVGCWNLDHRFVEQMRENGVEVLPFLPVRFPSFTSKVNYRNHRKIMVIDGKVGYIGGMNIALRYVKGIPLSNRRSSETTMPWRDTMLRLQGGIVYGLQRAFLIDWYFVDGTLITGHDYYPPLAPTPSASAPPSAPAASSVVGDCQSPLSALSPLSLVRDCQSPPSLLAQVVTSSPTNTFPEIMQGYVRAIAAAHRYIYIETPYFLPNEPVLFALKTAAVGGVDVRIICPLHSDSRFTEWASRSYLRELYEAGAKVYLYQPGFLHSKLMLIDDSLSTCGSTNVDFRSFENNFEANVFIYDEATTLRLKHIFLDDQSLSVPLQQLPTRLRPDFMQRLWESLTRLLAPLL